MFIPFNIVGFRGRYFNVQLWIAIVVRNHASVLDNYWSFDKRKIIINELYLLMSSLKSIAQNIQELLSLKI